MLTSGHGSRLLEAVGLKSQGPAVLAHVPLGLLIDAIRDLGVDLERERDFSTVES